MSIEHVFKGDGPGFALEGVNDAEPDRDGEAIEQVRELLFGEALRKQATLIAALEDRLDASDKAIVARIEKLEARLEEVARAGSESHGAALDELAAGIAELGARIDSARRR